MLGVARDWMAGKNSYNSYSTWSVPVELAVTVAPFPWPQLLQLRNSTNSNPIKSFKQLEIRRASSWAKPWIL